MLTVTLSRTITLLRHAHTLGRANLLDVVVVVRCCSLLFCVVFLLLCCVVLCRAMSCCVVCFAVLSCCVVVRCGDVRTFDARRSPLGVFVVVLLLCCCCSCCCCCCCCDVVLSLLRCAVCHVVVLSQTLVATLCCCSIVFVVCCVVKGLFCCCAASTSFVSCSGVVRSCAVRCCVGVMWRVVLGCLVSSVLRIPSSVFRVPCSVRSLLAPVVDGQNKAAAKCATAGVNTLRNIRWSKDPSTTFSQF